jgi:isopropylmalate/homocitrate/citramalate synthase
MDQPRAAGEPTLERVRALWPAILDAVGQQQQRMLREALGAATPVAVAGGELVVEADSEVHRSGLERGRRVVESAAAAVLGAGVRLVVRAAGGAQSGEEPRRLNQQTDREERLRSRRARDPALDTVADAMDLELLE